MQPSPYEKRPAPCIISIRVFILICMCVHVQHESTWRQRHTFRRETVCNALFLLTPTHFVANWLPAAATPRKISLFLLFLYYCCILLPNICIQATDGTTSRNGVNALKLATDNWPIGCSPVKGSYGLLFSMLSENKRMWGREPLMCMYDFCCFTFYFY